MKCTVVTLSPVARSPFSGNSLRRVNSSANHCQGIRALEYLYRYKERLNIATVAKQKSSDLTANTSHSSLHNMKSLKTLYIPHMPPRLYKAARYTHTESQQAASLELAQGQTAAYGI